MSFKIPGGIAPVLIAYSLLWFALGAIAVAWVSK